MGGFTAFPFRSFCVQGSMPRLSRARRDGRSLANQRYLYPHIPIRCDISIGKTEKCKAGTAFSPMLVNTREINIIVIILISAHGFPGVLCGKPKIISGAPLSLRDGNQRTSDPICMYRVRWGRRDCTGILGMQRWYTSNT